MSFFNGIILKPVHGIRSLCLLVILSNAFLACHFASSLFYSFVIQGSSSYLKLISATDEQKEPLFSYVNKILIISYLLPN